MKVLVVTVLNLNALALNNTLSMKTLVVTVLDYECGGCDGLGL